MSITEETRKAIRAGIESEAYNKGRRKSGQNHLTPYAPWLVHNLKSLKGHGNETDFLGFLQKSVQHRFLTQNFEPFRFGLRIRRDIRNRKMITVLLSGLTVLLPGWVIWKYWNCPCKFFSLGSWLVSSLSAPNGREVYNSSTDLNPNAITSIQLHCIQASRPHLADKTTSKPQSKYCMYQSSPLNLHIVPIPIYEINIQKEWHWPPNIFYIHGLTTWTLIMNFY